MSQYASDQRISVNLLESNGRIYFLQPGIGVIASGDNVESAYERFLGARRAFWSELEGAGLTGGDATAGVAASAVQRGRGVLAELGLFIAKFVIALTIIGSVAGFLVTRTVDRITMAVDQAAGSVKPVSLADVTRKAADIVKDFKSLSPEDKEALRRNIGAISRELDPIVDAWRNPPPGP
jgi:hypothetical protein